MKRWLPRILIVSGCGWLALMGVSESTTKASAYWQPSPRILIGFGSGSGAVVTSREDFRFTQDQRTGNMIYAFSGGTASKGSGVLVRWPIDAPNVKVGPLHILSFPLWFPAVASLIPGLWLWWRNRPYPKGHCQTCGYDLTGLTEPRCPECATGFEMEAGV